MGVSYLYRAQNSLYNVYKKVSLKAPTHGLWNANASENPLKSKIIYCLIVIFYILVHIMLKVKMFLDIFFRH